MQVAEHISSQLSIPTIGIGAGNQTDGQVLVFHDLVQFGVSRVPKFVKTYMNSNEDIKQSLIQYISEVKTMDFPSVHHSFTMKEEELENLYGGKK